MVGDGEAEELLCLRLCDGVACAGEGGEELGRGGGCGGGKMILVDEVKGKGKKAKGEVIGLGVLVARAVISEHADVMTGEEELERCAEGAARDVLDAMVRGSVM